eukprot:1181398-Prorocentrum_minimum.AAC.1
MLDRGRLSCYTLGVVHVFTYRNSCCLCSEATGDGGLRLVLPCPLAATPSARSLSGAISVPLEAACRGDDASVRSRSYLGPPSSEGANSRGCPRSASRVSPYAPTLLEGGHVTHELQYYRCER